jgi:hypothetical protein
VGALVVEGQDVALVVEHHQVAQGPLQPDEGLRLGDLAAVGDQVPPGS